MILTGAGLIRFGIVSEVFGGSFFRDFFDWRRPDHKRSSSLEAFELRMSRVLLAVGVLFVLARVCLHVV